MTWKAPESRLYLRAEEISRDISGCHEVIVIRYNPSHNYWSAIAPVKPPRKRDRYRQGTGRSVEEALADLVKILNAQKERGHSSACRNRRSGS